MALPLPAAETVRALDFMESCERWLAPSDRRALLRGARRVRARDTGRPLMDRIASLLRDLDGAHDPHRAARAGVRRLVGPAPDDFIVGVVAVLAVECAGAGRRSDGIVG